MPVPDASIEKCAGKASEHRVAWFVVLERAREIHDYERAAQALGKLKRLGVTIKFRSLTARLKTAKKREDATSSARVAKAGAAP